MNDCVHFWIIDPPNGMTSQGICQYCEERKDFENSTPLDRGGSYWHKSKNGTWENRKQMLKAEESLDDEKQGSLHGTQEGR